MSTESPEPSWIAKVPLLPRTAEEAEFLSPGSRYPLAGSLTVTRRANPGLMGTARAVAWLKATSGISDVSNAYGPFVTIRGLKPEIDFKEFTRIWKSVKPDDGTVREQHPFAPQWFDRLRETLLQSSADPLRGVVELLWADGGTGSTPLSTRGEHFLEHLTLLPTDGLGRYAAGQGEQEGYVVDRWTHAVLRGKPGRARAAILAQRLSASARLRMASRGMMLDSMLVGR